MASYVDNGNKLDWALPFQRTGDFPLDRSSIFSSYADAVKYAAGSSSNPDSRGLQGSSYVGQIIAVYENNTVDIYKIEADRSLTLVGAGADDYPDLSNKPSINDVTLVGNKTGNDLSLASLQSVSDINSKIPAQASSSNQLADKNFVNSSISTATATFRGTYTNLQTLQAVDGDKNDYAFYSHTDSAGNTVYDRYKYVGAQSERLPEGYTLAGGVKAQVGTWLNTGINIRNTTTVELDIKTDMVAGYLFGVNYLYRSGHYEGVAIQTTTNNNRFSISGGTNSFYTTLQSTNYYKVEITPEKIYCDDVELGANNLLAYNTGEYSHAYDIYLFNTHRSSIDVPMTNVGAGYIYIKSFKAYEGNTLVAEYIPCTRNSDNKVGFYDTVSETFKTENNEAGTVDIQALPTTDIDKWAYEYSLNNSSFTSEQWATINSGVTSQMATDVTNIKGMIPNQASSNNQLADKDFVNSSISTATATFRGTFTSLNTLQATEGDKNDYAFYSHTDSAGNTVYDRYKYVGLPESKVPEGYTQLASVEVGYSGGSGYIDTGIKINSNDNIYLHYYCESNVNANYFFGASDSNSNLITLGKNFNSGAFFKTNLDSLGVSTGTTQKLSVTNNIMYVNDSPVGSMRITSVDSNIYIFGYNNNGVYSGQQPPKSRLYEFAIFDSNNDKRIELIPCKRDLDNVVGVYDTVSNNFITPINGVLKANQISSNKWVYEYSLNNSSFTSAQWAALNSGVTSSTVTSVSNIETLIPNNATIINQLADKDFVNSSISTATANFKGTFTNLATLQSTEGDRNDYAFYSHQDSSGNTVYDRYKYVGLPETRVPVEYTEVYSIGLTGTSGPRINTGIVLKNNYSIETRMSFGAVNYYTNRYYWGANDGTNYFRLQKPGTSILKLDSSGGSSNTVGIENAEYLIEVKNNKFYVNGSVSGNAVVPNIGDDYPLFLFGYNNQGSIATNGNITTSFHSFKVWDDEGELILDLVPCLNYENEAGMYDVVSGQFFGGNFSTVPLTTDRWVYEYTLNNSSFTAQQWATINSGLTSQTATDVSNINAMIPVQASSNNQLADKDYVDSAISTATATFRGTFTNLQTLQNTDGDRNDYAFYSHQDTAGNTIYDRYKYVGLPDSRVPAGYTEMLYLQKPRAGTAYIDTGYKIQSTDKIYMKCYGWEYEATEYDVFGAGDGNGKFFRIHKQYLGGNAVVQTNNGSIYAAQLYNGTAIIECYDGKVYVSDINGENKTLKGNLTIDTVNANMFLFAYNNNNSSISRYPQWVKMADFIVYDQNDNKKLELVPCSDSLGNNGYYDTVGRRFIAPTDGTLNATAISTDKWLFEYSLNNSSFTSGQWATINSGLVNHVTSTGYDATKTQVLKNVNGTLMWQDET